MAVELFDLRAKVTASTHAVLGAVATATGADISEIARDVLHEWAEKQIAIARHIFGSLPELTPIVESEAPAPAPNARREWISRAVRAQIYVRDGGQCRYCDVALATDGDWHIDHVLAVSRGGTNEPANLALACVTCNLKKAAGGPEKLRVA